MGARGAQTLLGCKNSQGQRSYFLMVNISLIHAILPSNAAHAPLRCGTAVQQGGQTTGGPLWSSKWR